MDGISESGESIQLVRAMINPNVTVQEIEAKKYRPPMASMFYIAEKAQMY